MQTEHYMANMDRSGHAERIGFLGPERDDERAGPQARHVVAPPELGPAGGPGQPARRAAAPLDEERRPA
jgi:hypothetical protein